MRSPPPRRACRPSQLVPTRDDGVLSCVPTTECCSLQSHADVGSLQGFLTPLVARIAEEEGALAAFATPLFDKLEQEAQQTTLLGGFTPIYNGARAESLMPLRRLPLTFARIVEASKRTEASPIPNTRAACRYPFLERRWHDCGTMVAHL